MSGAEMRLGRLFDKESGRSFVAAFDHGLTTKVPPESGSPTEVVERIVSSCEPDGVLISPGTLNRTSHLFAFRGAPIPLLRADIILNDERVKDLGEQHRVLCSPTDAAALGAGGIVMFLILGVETGQMFADNTRAIANAAGEAHRLGLPLIVETVLWGSRITDRRDPDMLAFGCRMAAELGADAIKTEYTGDPETMKPVIEGCGVPVLTLGGPKGDSEEELIQMTREAMDAGAKGIVYGRNIWQADDPARISSSIREVVHGVPARN